MNRSLNILPLTPGSRPRAWPSSRWPRLRYWVCSTTLECTSHENNLFSPGLRPFPRILLLKYPIHWACPTCVLLDLRLGPVSWLCFICMRLHVYSVRHGHRPLFWLIRLRLKPRSGILGMTSSPRPLHRSTSLPSFEAPSRQELSSSSFLGVSVASAWFSWSSSRRELSLWQVKECKDFSSFHPESNQSYSTTELKDNKARWR